MQTSLFSFFLLFPLIVFSQTDTIALDSNFQVEFVAYWAIGDEYRYEVEKHDIRYKGEERTKDDTTRYTALLTVLDSTATSYRLSWKFETYEMPPNLSEQVEEMIAEPSTEMAAAMRFDEIVFTTDELGTFQQIENIEEIVKVVDLFIDQAKTGIAGEYADDPDGLKRVEKALDVTYNAMRGRSFIETSMFVELVHLLNPMGAAFSPRDTTFYDDVFPNNFGGPGIKANGRYYFETVNVKDDYCHLKQYVDLDPGDTQLMLKDYFTRLGLDNEKMMDILDKSNYNIWEDNDYYYYYYPGIPISVDCMRVLDFTMNGENAKVVKRYILDWID
jgi:hypothetical protein